MFWLTWCFITIFLLKEADESAHDVTKMSEPKETKGGGSDATSIQQIKTSDLISWSFQIARGMEFLASKKVKDTSLLYYILIECNNIW